MLVIAHALIHILSTRFNGINDLVTETFLTSQLHILYESYPWLFGF